MQTEGVKGLGGQTWAPLAYAINAMVSKDEIEQRFGNGWDLVRAWGGEQPDRFPGRWYHLKRK